MSDITIKYQDLTRKGEAVSLGLSDRATVGHVKSQIENKTGIPRGQQALFYKQKVLRDEDTLCDLSILNNATLKLLPRERIKVNVQSKQGRDASLWVRLSDTVSFVKMRIEQEAKIILGDRHLSYAGETMADDAALSAYGLNSGSILTFDEEKTECYVKLGNENPDEDSCILDSYSVASDRQFSETVTQLQNDLKLVRDKLHALDSKVGEQGSYVEGTLAELRQFVSSQFQGLLDGVQDVNGNQKALKLECLSLHEKTACIERNLSESSGQVEEVAARLVQVEENLSHVEEVQEVEMKERLKLQKELEESKSIRKQFMQSFEKHQALEEWMGNEMKRIKMSDKNLQDEFDSMRQDFANKTSKLDQTDDALAESLVRHKLETQKGVDFSKCFHLKDCEDLKMLCFKIWCTEGYTSVLGDINETFKSLFLPKCIYPVFYEYVSLLKEYTQHVVQNTFEATVDQKQDFVNSNDLKVLVTSLQKISEDKPVDNKVDAHLAVCRLRKTQGRKTKLGQKHGNDKTMEDLCKRLEAILTAVCTLEKEEYYKFHQQEETKDVPPFKKINPTMSCYVHALLHKVLARPDALPLDVKAPMELEVDISGRVQEGTDDHERIFTCGEFKARIKGNGAKAKKQTTNYVKIVAFICNCVELHLVKANCILYYLFGSENGLKKPSHEELAYTIKQESRQICFLDESKKHERGGAVKKHAIRVMYETIKMK